MPFCYSCGAQLRENAKFCSKCGTKIINVANASTNPPQETLNKSEEGISKNDLISCLSLYAEHLSILESILSSLLPKPKLRPLSEIVNWQYLSINEYSSEIAKVWSEDIESFVTNKLHNWTTLACRSVQYIPSLRSLLFNLSDSSLRKLYPLFKKASDDFDYAKRNNGKIVCYGKPEEPSYIWPSVHYLGSSMDEESFVREFRKPLNLEKLHIEISAFSGINSEFSTGSGVFKPYLSYSKTEVVTETVGLFKKKEQSRIVEYKCQSYALREFHEALCEEMMNSFDNIRGDAQYKWLPATISSFNEIVRNIKPLINKFSLPVSYRTSADALAIARILRDGKADTWKEAINLYDTETYRKQVLGSLSDIKKELFALRQTVTEYGKANLAVTSAVLAEMKTANILLAEEKKKLSSIATSTFITAVFGD